ncbi:MAG TPA: DUF6559 family protein [Rhizomicrobium sp.]|jgi:hypothetical protein|nr:DUF6559 family protein [Rhizomicrobium sp.]
MFDAWRLRHAARAYAAKLPRRLVRDYGERDPYTVPQVRNAIVHAGLNPRYAVLAYARFLPRSDFENLLLGLEVQLPYDDARKLFVANEPVALTSRAGSRVRDPDSG